MKLRRNTGITLIALIITIIVLLILAGTTIRILTGENGILNKAIVARQKTEKAEIIEQITLDIVSLQLNSKSGDITEIELENILKKYVTNPETDIVKNKDKTIKEIITKKGNYKIPLS